MRVFLCLLFSFCSLAWSQTVVEFWHSQDVTEDLIQSFADEFNARQSDYQIIPRYAGNYQEAAIKLVAALNSNDAPVMFDAELTVFPRLVEEAALAELSTLTDSLPEALVDDFYESPWRYGEIDNGRYGLPWNTSMPVLFYNATAFKQRGVTPPQTWDEFEAAAERLTTRNTKGYINVAIAYIFESLVSTRGGSVITENGEPNFNSPEAIDALTMLQRMTKNRSAIAKGFAEVDQALVDFARTKAMMAIAGQAFFPQGERFSVAFEIAAVPLPVGSSTAIPLTGTQLVVFKDASEAQQQGAFAFWQYLMEDDPQRRWVTRSYFLPTRRSVAASLENWYTEDPSRRAALSQLEQAIFRPRVGLYTVWQGYLLEAIERATKTNVDPASVLNDAQQRALQER